MNTDISAAAAALLAPFLPLLLQAGENAVKKTMEAASVALGKAGGEAAWAIASRAWEKIRAKADDRDGVEAAARSVRLEPEEPATQELLVRALKRLFDREPELAEAIRIEVSSMRSIQEMTAEDDGRIERASQRQDGGGEQTMTARRGGAIVDAVQVQTGKK